MNHTKKKIVKLFLVEDPKNTYEGISGYYDLFYNYNGCREPTLIYLLISKDGCWKLKSLRRLEKSSISWLMSDQLPSFLQAHTSMKKKKS